jgi:transposase
MTLLPPGVKVHLAYGYTDMRKGMDGLALLVQEVLQQDPFSGHLFVFRGRKANLITVVFWDGSGLCLFIKRLEHGVFLWPSDIEPGRTLALTSASSRPCSTGSTGALQSVNGARLSQGDAAAY